MMVQWEQLNPTEQYFNLLEAWLRLGRPEMVGEKGSLWADSLAKCIQVWKELPVKGHRYNLKKPQDIFLMGIGREFYQLALMDLFGLVEVEIPTRPIAPWCPAAIRHVPFGDAVFTLLTDNLLETILGRRLPALEIDDQEDEDEEDGEFDDQEDEDEDGEFDDREEGAWKLPRFGVWQPIFQPYFPSWQKNLMLPERQARKGTFVFRVSLGEIWRLIAMPSHKTLNDLVHVILRSVKFDDDHLHEFTFRDRMGATLRVNHPATNEPPYSDEVRIGTLPLEPGQTMELTYDFGDNWPFTVKLERIEPPDDKRKAPRILESHGKAPQQYPHWDD